MSASPKVVQHPRVKRQWVASKSTTANSNWTTVWRGIDTDLLQGFAQLRARAREQAQNSDHVRGFLALVESSVIGRQGISLQARVRLRSGKPDRRTNDAIEEAWAEWSRRGRCEVTGQYSWRSVQAQVVRTVARDGEALVRLVDLGDLRLQMIDPGCLDHSYSVDELPGGGCIRLGVELDPFPRPVAYYLTEEPPLRGGSYRAHGYKRERVPADELLHVYLPEWVWMTRGVPWTATSLHRLHMLQGYEDAEITAARVASSKMGFYKPSPDAPDPVFEEGPAGDLAQTLSPGGMEVLPTGYDFVGFDPQHPTGQFGDFVKSCLRSISTGLGVSYNTLANDLEGVNYSSLRQGALNERDLWMGIQEWFVESFVSPVFERWLANAVDLGTITYPSGRPILPQGQEVPPEALRRLGRVAWQPRRWQWVDPLKEVQAHKEAVALRVRSLSDIIREQGRDPDEVWDELAQDQTKLAELGLTIAAPDQPEPEAMPDEQDPED